MTDHVEVTEAAGVLTLRFNRPEKKNALTDAMYHALADAMEEAEEGAGAILFLGAGGAFTAGNDIADFLAQATGGGRPEERGVARFLRAQLEGSVPMVAGVDGLAVGVGATTLLQCDYVVASDRAVLKTPFTDLGVVPENASSILGPRIMGHPRAFEMLAMGESFDAARAEAAGIVNRVVAPEALEETARAAAETIAAKPREAMRAARRLLRGDMAPVRAAMTEESRIFGERLMSAEARAAFEGFMTRKAG